MEEQLQDEGYNAYVAGKKKSDNPYPVDSFNYVNWFIGWYDGFHMEQ